MPRIDRRLLSVLLAWATLAGCGALGPWGRSAGAVVVASASGGTGQELAIPRRERLYRGKGALRRQVLKDAEKLKRGEPLDKTAGTGRSAPKRSGRFIPTDEWQEVPDGTPIPKGLHVKMDLEEGKTYARLMQPTMPTPIPLSTARPKRKGLEGSLPLLACWGGAALGAGLFYRASQAPGGLRRVIAPALLGYFALVNAAGAIAVAHDKSQAEQGRWRVPEKHLHAHAGAGGGVGGRIHGHEAVQAQDTEGLLSGPICPGDGGQSLRVLGGAASSRRQVIVCSAGLGAAFLRAQDALGASSEANALGAFASDANVC